MGQGCIGGDGFAELLAHPAVRGVPVVLETPGGAREHREDIALVIALAAPVQGSRVSGAQFHDPGGR